MFRQCRECGIVAHTLDDLILFKKHKAKLYGVENICKQCHNNKMKTQGIKWRANNKDKNCAKSAKYRASKLKQTPKWLSDNDLIMIECFYKEAQRLTNETGIQHHVDHIIPLSRGGLHEPYNLRVITAEENLIKNNRLISEMEV